MSALERLLNDRKKKAAAAEIVKEDVESSDESDLEVEQKTEKDNAIVEKLEEVASYVSVTPLTSLSRKSSNYVTQQTGKLAALLRYMVFEEVCRLCLPCAAHLPLSSPLVHQFDDKVFLLLADEAYERWRG